MPMQNAKLLLPSDFCREALKAIFFHTILFNIKRLTGSGRKRGRILFKLVSFNRVCPSFKTCQCHQNISKTDFNRLNTKRHGHILEGQTDKQPSIDSKLLSVFVFGIIKSGFILKSSQLLRTYVRT